MALKLRLVLASSFALLSACSASRSGEVSREPASSSSRDARLQVLVVKDARHGFNPGDGLWQIAKQIRKPTLIKFFPWSRGYTSSPTGHGVQETTRGGADVGALRARMWAYPDRARIEVLPSDSSLRAEIDASDLVAIDSTHPEFPYAISKSKPLILLDGFRGELLRAMAFERLGIGAAPTRVDRMGFAATAALEDPELRRAYARMRGRYAEAGAKWVDLLRDDIQGVDLNALFLHEFDGVRARSRTAAKEEKELLAAEESFRKAWASAQRDFGTRPSETKARLTRADAKPEDFAKLSSLYRDYDRYSRLQTEFFANEIERVAIGVFPTSLKVGSRAWTEAAEALFGVTEAARFYREQTNSYGTPEDGGRRLLALTGLFNGARTYFAKIGYKVPKTSGLKEIGYYLHGIGGFLSAIPDLMNSERGRVDKTPITASIEQIFRGAGNGAGARIDIQDLDTEQARQKHEASNGVVIYAINHTTAQRDMVFMSNLKLHNTLLVAYGLMYPNFAGKALYDDENFIFVGRQGGEPLAQTLRSLEAGQTRKIVIYPEGSLATGMGFDSRPIAPSFARGFVEKLIEAGHRPMIVPVTCTTCEIFSVRESFFSVEGKELDIKGFVHEPISTEEIKGLLDRGQDSTLTSLMRWHWMTDKGTDSTKSGGHLNVAEIRRRLGVVYGLGEAWKACAVSVARDKPCI